MKRMKVMKKNKKAIFKIKVNQKNQIKVQKIIQKIKTIIIILFNLILNKMVLMI